MTNATDRLKGRVKQSMDFALDEDGEAATVQGEPRERLTIEEEKQTKKFLFQLVSHLDGKRSEPFVQSWDGLTKALTTWRDEEPESFKEKNVYDDFILLVAVLDDKETTIPATPLITIKTYLQTVGQEKLDV